MPFPSIALGITCIIVPYVRLYAINRGLFYLRSYKEVLKRVRVQASFREGAARTIVIFVVPPEGQYCFNSVMSWRVRMSY